ncbi:MAG: hypothetical protein H6732_14175 [Alphaproteobacteria bacterium]|nr:hypothetical protein [Alphaproteobacteria bacterium]
MAMVAVAAMVATSSAFALKLGPKKGFDVFSVDGKGGGWVLHHAPGRGDSLWGCGDIGKVESCTQIYFDAWRSASTIKVLHISKDSQKAWVVVTAAGMSDTLHACSDPEGSPTCAPVELDMLPKLSKIERTWPSLECDFECGTDCCGKNLPDDDPRRAIEDASKADIWIQVGPPAPGPANLYACRDLAKSPVCTLALPNWLAYDREDIGISKVEDIVSEGPDGEKIYGPGVNIGKIDEDGVAYAAGLREDMVIIKVDEFTVDRAAHARAMMAQHPALHPMTITLSDGKTVEIRANRKPKKK